MAIRPRLRGSNGQFVGKGQSSSGGSIRVEIDAEKAAAVFNSFNASRMYGLMETLGALIVGQTKRRIATEKRSPDGDEWAPLKPSTIARRRKRSNSILSDTGRLLGSISHTATSNSVTIGSNVFYGKFHQSGTKRMVARPFMGISDQNMVQIRQAIDAWVETLI